MKTTMYWAVAAFVASLFISNVLATPPLVIPPLNPAAPMSIYVNVNTDNVFRGRVRGRITMTQPAVGQPITITSQLYYVAFDTRVVANPPPVAPTTGHDWRVHTKTIIKPYECATAGPVFDPNGLMNNPAYVCQPGNQAGCAPGDFGGKFGTLSIGIDKNAAPQNFVDATPVASIPDLYRMSIVIYMGGQLTEISNWLGCGIIEQPLKFTVQFAADSGCITDVDPNGVNTVVGAVEVAQNMDGTITFTPTLTGTGGGATTGHPMHVHNKAPRIKKRCETVGTHYDPFFKEYDPWGKQNPDYQCAPPNPLPAGADPEAFKLECYSGDLTGKEGLLNLPAAGIPFIEKHLDLVDVLGRSLVIHRENNGQTKIAMAKIPAPQFCSTEMYLIITGSMIAVKFLVLVIVQFVAE